MLQLYSKRKVLVPPWFRATVGGNLTSEMAKIVSCSSSSSEEGRKEGGCVASCCTLDCVVHTLVSLFLITNVLILNTMLHDYYSCVQPH